MHRIVPACRAILRRPPTWRLRRPLAWAWPGGRTGKQPERTGDTVAPRRRSHLLALARSPAPALRLVLRVPSGAAYISTYRRAGKLPGNRILRRPQSVFVELACEVYRGWRETSAFCVAAKSVLEQAN